MGDAPIAHVKRGLPCVTALVSGMKRETTRVHYELEARIGKLTVDPRTHKRHFQCGVDEEFLAQVLLRLEAAADDPESRWDPPTPWTQQVDTFYTLPSGLYVRSSVITGMGDTNGEVEPSTAVHVMKTDVDTCDMQWNNDGIGVMRGENDELYDVRLSLKREEVVYENELPDRVDLPITVRIKQRRSFRYTPDGTDRAAWSIDITLVFAADNYENALAVLKSGKPTSREIEIECLTPHMEMKRTGNDKQRVGLTLLLYVAGMFGVNAGAHTQLLPVAKNSAGAKQHPHRGPT